eukprot:CAMPEP_0182533132 /NCGR_PEP_ID=MMETSP1323-20130603/13147_1 /TAXON_ID=236787 /ORGANISM="Florenciella parvula, Strain RCC1693" /LENGTH=58 /DNA_ID=CAMNT_0024742975 /DNA_START=253 /DNA_END=429 /DNA_ORIENTATION=+
MGVLDALLEALEVRIRAAARVLFAKEAVESLLVARLLRVSQRILEGGKVEESEDGLLH